MYTLEEYQSWNHELFLQTGYKMVSTTKTIIIMYFIWINATNTNTSFASGVLISLASRISI